MKKKSLLIASVAGIVILLSLIYISQPVSIAEANSTDSSDKSIKSTGNNVIDAKTILNDTNINTANTPKMTNSDFDRSVELSEFSRLLEGKPKPSEEDIKIAENTAKFINYQSNINPILEDKNKPVSHDEFLSLTKETDRLQSENYLLLGEAFVIKDRLLRSQYNGRQLEDELTRLKAETQAKHSALLAANANTPASIQFKEYKNQENAILKEANSMTSFPNNMTKEQYILSKLNAIQR
jgi:hypothetical protein